MMVVRFPASPVGYRRASITMTLSTVLAAQRQTAMPLPVPPPEVVAPAFALAVGLVTRWITLRQRDRQDERGTLLAAFQESQRTLSELRAHVVTLQGHLDNANLLIADLIARVQQGADEREALRQALQIHGIECPSHRGEGHVP